MSLKGDMIYVVPGSKGLPVSRSPRTFVLDCNIT